MEKEIQFFRKKHMGCILLNRPEALHALSLSMVKAMYKQLLDWEKDDSIWGVIVQATPCRAFCAGGDVRWLYTMGKNSLDFFWHEYRLNALIGHFRKPYITLMDGITMGGGVGISLHGSHPIATEHFVFAMPETTIGFFPDVGSSFLLSHLPHGMGMYLGLTGQRIGAAEARRLGLVRYIIPANSLEDVIQNLIDLHHPKDFHISINKCMETIQLDDNILPLMDKKLLKKIKKAFTQPSLESILQVLSTFQDDFGDQTLTLLKSLSPLSLKVTFEQLRRAAHLNLKQCLAMDQKLVPHFIQDHDFYEGIRALLIDKDKSPHWEPPTLTAVDQAKVESYFL